MKNLYIILLALAGLILLPACSNEEKWNEVPNDMILANVNGRIITVQDFIRRAEFTPRPNYCRNDSYIHKKIILNSLIAEKLYALALSDSAAIHRDPAFHNHLEGRRTQAMRQMLYKLEGLDKVNVDSSDILRKMKVAGRKYQIEYVPLMKNSLPDNDQQRQQYLKDYFAGLDEEHKFIRDVNFQDELQPELFKALYDFIPDKNQFLGPFSFDQDIDMIVRVKGWTEQMIMGETMFNDRYARVEEKLKTDRAAQIYSEYVAELMNGKTMELNPPAFTKLVEFLAPLYIKSKEDKQERFDEKFWGKNRTDRPALPNFPELDPELELLNYEGRGVSIKAFHEMLDTHPLVFRKRKLTKADFAEQLRFAVADLIRDKELDKIAYDRGLDRHYAVNLNVELWQDNFLSLYHKKQLLKSAPDNIDDQKLFDDYLNPYFNTLVEEYSDAIKINTDLFEKIQISSTDMMALHTNLPYQVVVPAFPMLTDHNRLDYGSTINPIEKD